MMHTLHDNFGRTVRYLRLSVTPSCSMRCTYCRPANGGGDASGPVIMSSDEIVSLVRHLTAHHGVTKVRLTGGEPTVRPDLLEIIRHVAAFPQLRELAMTTNGLTLARDAQRLAEAGLTRVNISLDSLNPQRFARVTGVDGLDRVREGIDATIACGLTPVKLNCVVLRGENDEDLPDLLRFAASRQCEMRFIELMPMGPLANQWADRFVAASQMRQTLSSVVEHWSAVSTGADSARRYRVRLRGGMSGTVGFITAMSCNFCDACDRLRIASDGSVFPCLMDDARGNIMPAMRPTFQPSVMDDILHRAMTRKAAEHPVVGVSVMTNIGG